MLTNAIGSEVYDTSKKDELIAEFKTDRFTFRSSYFMIQGLKIVLKMLVLPFFVLALFCFGMKRNKVH